jgi:hypothetical protein
MCRKHYVVGEYLGARAVGEGVMGIFFIVWPFLKQNLRNEPDKFFLPNMALFSRASEFVTYEEVTLVHMTQL